MKFKPHDYQSFATNFIMNNKISAILLECGLGKTIITLNAIDELMLDYFDVCKVLVIAPLRVATSSWPSEFKKWEHLKHLTYSLAIGSEKERLSALNEKSHIYIINRENVEWLINRSGVRFDFDMVIIDELSSFKSHRSKRFKSLIGVRNRIDRIVGLTGTPSSNGLMDLWAQFRILDYGKRLGRYITHYRKKYFVPLVTNGMQVYSYKPKENAEQEIYKQISDISISMKSADYIKMPECIMNGVDVYLRGDDYECYEKFRKEFVTQLENVEITAVNAAVLSGKLVQMANGAVYDENKEWHHIHDEKLSALEELVEEANGKPVLIAYWYQSDLERIKERLKVREIKTNKDIDDWNEGKIPIAIMHPASAGHGLNLQAGGSTLIWFSLTWSLELYQQTNARLWRQGQNETVVIHHIVAKETIDEDIMLALKRKEKTQNALLNAVKAKLNKE